MGEKKRVEIVQNAPPPTVARSVPEGRGLTVYEPQNLRPVVAVQTPAANPTLVAEEGIVSRIPRAGEPGVVHEVAQVIWRVEDPAAVPPPPAIPPIVSQIPPIICFPRRKVKLIVGSETSISNAEADDYPWAMTQKPLGKPVVVGGKMVAVYAAAKIHSFSLDGDVWTVVINLVFAYIDDEETHKFWETKYRQDEEKHRRALEAALVSALERVKLVPGRVFRFVGGPPMSREDAAANGYHYWVSDARSPTRVEIDDSKVQSEIFKARDEYSEGIGSLFHWKVFWWKWFRKERYRRYLFGLHIVHRQQDADLDPKETSALLTDTAGLAGGVVSSLCAVVYGQNLAVSAKLEEKGRQPISKTEVGTYMTYHSDE